MGGTMDMIKGAYQMTKGAIKLASGSIIPAGVANTIRNMYFNKICRRISRQNKS